MTTYFLDDGGSNTAPYDTEAKAANALSTIDAIPWVGGDIVKANSTHAEVINATTSYTAPLTGAPVRLLSVTYNGSGTGAITPGASISVGTGNYLYSYTGKIVLVGMTIQGQDGFGGNYVTSFGHTNAGPHTIHLDQCTVTQRGTGSYATLEFGPEPGNNIEDSAVILTDTTLNITDDGVNSFIQVCCGRIEFHRVTLGGTGVPTSLFRPDYASSLNLYCKDCDFSATAWTNLFRNDNHFSGVAIFENCKFPASFTSIFSTTVLSEGTATVILIDSPDGDDADTHYQMITENYMGTCTMQTGTYVGASNGTENLALSMVATANATREFPLQSPPIVTTNITPGALTATVKILYDQAADLKNDDVWAEHHYKGTSGTTLGSMASDDKLDNVLDNPTDLTDGTLGDWTVSPSMTNGNADELITNFTTAETGPISTVVHSTTTVEVFVDIEVGIA